MKIIATILLMFALTGRGGYHYHPRPDVIIQDGGYWERGHHHDHDHDHDHDHNRGHEHHEHGRR